MKALPCLLLLAMPVAAQSTVGMSIGQLHTYYKDHPTLGGWRVSNDSLGRMLVSVYQHTKKRVIVSFLRDSTVVMTTVLAPKEQLSLMRQTCDKKYSASGDNTWLDMGRGLIITVQPHAELAVVTYTALPK